MSKKYFIFVLALSIAFSFSIGAFAQDLISPNVTVIDDYTIKGKKNFYTGYEPGDSEGNVNVVIEIPKGTTGKWEVSLEEGTIIWEFKKGKPREVTYNGGYIANYGSIPKTAMPKEFGGDGEPIDVVVVGAPIPRGEVIKAKIIGLLKLMEDGEFDGKLLAVQKGSPEDDVSSLEEFNSKFGGVLDQLSSWFENYKGPDSDMKVEGIGEAGEATEILITSIDAYNAASE